ncbi:MAG: O-antigen ligase family protein [Bryobacteraceae bacterium]
MSLPRSFLARAARWLTFASAVAILFSIAASQILLGLALAALFLSGEKLRLPRIWLPLALFMLGTVVSWLANGQFAVGIPQIKKFYVFGELLIVFSLLRDIQWIRRVFLVWAGFGAITATLGAIQFAAKVQEAHRLGQTFYDYYVARRITGFTSHWNTYSAEQMFALIMLSAFVLFAPGGRRRWWLPATAAALMALALCLAETRGVWIATAVAGLYLLWSWNRKLTLAVPVLAFVAFLISPADIREREESVVHPGKNDSNGFRLVAWRTGIRLVEQHPLLGLGPDVVKLRFRDSVPADIPRPLPDGFYGHLHNIYLQYAADRGIPTMLMMMWVLIQALLDFSRGLHKLPRSPANRRFLLHGAVAVILATMVEGVVEYNLGDSEVLTMFLVVLACGYLALEPGLAMD